MTKSEYYLVTFQWIEIPIAPVWFSAVPEAERSKSFEAGSPVKLQCELSDPTNQTCWYEDGINRLPKSGIDTDSEGNKKTLVMKSPTSSCSGVYSCKTDVDSDFNDFYVEVKGDMLSFFSWQHVVIVESHALSWPLISKEPRPDHHHHIHHQLISLKVLISLNI